MSDVRRKQEGDLTPFPSPEAIGLTGMIGRLYDELRLLAARADAAGLDTASANAVLSEVVTPGSSGITGPEGEDI